MKALLITAGAGVAVAGALGIALFASQKQVERQEDLVAECRTSLATEESVTATLELDKELLRETIERQNASIEALAERAAELASRADERAIQVLDIDAPAATGEGAEAMQEWWDEHVGP